MCIQNCFKEMYLNFFDSHIYTMLYYERKSCNNFIMKSRKLSPHADTTKK